MTTVAAEITWATHESELKSFLGVSGSGEDLKLRLWLAAATKAADEYIDTTAYPLVDEDDVALDLDSDAHSGIKLGVYEFVQHSRALAKRPFGLTSAKTDDLSESYAYKSRISGGIATPEDILSAVSHRWWPYKKDILA